MPARSKRILLATIGSLGDLHPCLALALGLRDRGHHPVIASTELYRAKVQSLGLEFHPIRPNIGARDPQLMRDLMDMRRGPEFLLRRLILPSLRDTYDDLAVAAVGADLMIAGEIVFAAPLLAEELRLPWISAILSPFSFLSAHDPAVSPMAPSLAFLRHAGWLMNKILLTAGRLAVRPWWRPVRRLRKELGLSPGRDPLFHDKFSPDLVLALFSEQIARPQPDWPANTIQPGYVYFDSESSAPDITPELNSFLASGEPPVVFTLGSSAVHDPRGFFEESARAAKAIGRRAVLLVGDNPPAANLGPDCIAVSYAPFSLLFPHAAVVVHQGGSGTTAQALRAGRPALVMPCGFDQPDNAARLQRLGAGLTLSRNRYRAATAAGALNRLLTEPGFSAKARTIGARLQAEDGLRGACDAIEQLLFRVP